MEDVAQRDGDPRDATRPLSVDQAANGVPRSPASTAPTGVTASPTTPSWPGSNRSPRGAAWPAGSTSASNGPATASRGGGRPRGEQIDRGLWVSYVATVADGPPTLLHGDAHIGNTYVLPDDTVGFLDWQVVRRGNHCLDLGYFLQGAISVADRQAHEADLVAHYHQSLDLPDDERPDLDAVWLRYRASVAHGLTLWLATAASDWQRPEVSLRSPSATPPRSWTSRRRAPSTSSLGSLRPRRLARRRVRRRRGGGRCRGR